MKKKKMKQGLSSSASSSAFSSNITSSQEEIARDICFRLSFVKREYEGIVTNACDVSDALGRDTKKFVELGYGTSEFYTVARSTGSAPVIDRDGVHLVLDRVWEIKGYRTDSGLTKGYFSSKTEDLISLADEGFYPDPELPSQSSSSSSSPTTNDGNEPSKVKQRYTRIIDTCQVAMLKTSDEVATCLIVGVRLDPNKRVFIPSEGEGRHPLAAFARSGCETAHYYDPDLGGYARYVPCGRVVPLFFMLFRKVRSSALWLGISNPELNSAEKPVIDAVPLRDSSGAIRFLQALVQNTRKLWAAEASASKAVLMRRKVFLKTADFVCVTTAHPDFEIDFTACPRAQCNWDTLGSPSDVYMVMTLYTFAVYVKRMLEMLTGTRVEILFPPNPSEWQLHCRIVCVDKMSPEEERRKSKERTTGAWCGGRKYLSVEKVIMDVAEGRLCAGYSSVQKIDTKYMPPPPSSCDILSTRQCEISSGGINISLCEYFVQQYPNAFNSYWYGEGDPDDLELLSN